MHTQEFIKKSNEIHHNKYDYSLVDYSSAKNKVIITCSIHGNFFQTPTNHLYGQGCRLCGISKRNKEKTKSNDSFVVESKKIHNDKYDYSKVNYVNNYTKVIIICLVHGDFLQNPSNHLKGKGCILCRGDQSRSLYVKSQIDFVNQANMIHNHKYDYSKTDYYNSYTKIIISCKSHGDFLQLPVKHLCGQGCPKCNHVISKLEVEWLDSLFVPQEFRHKTVKINNKKYMVDAYNPYTKTIYEFYGDYWHGNPNKYKSDEINLTVKKSFGNLYTKTINREVILKNSGYSIIFIWESDYLKIKELI